MNMKIKSVLEKIRELHPEEKEQLIQKIEQTACENEITFGGCARCLLSAFQQHLGIEDSNAFKAAIPLGAGIARNGQACGGLVGGLMIIGVIFADGKLELAKDSATYQETMARSFKLCDRFKEEFGGLTCRDVQKSIFGRYWDLRDPEQQQEFSVLRRDELHSKCGDVLMVKSARLTAEAIFEPSP